MLCKVCACPQMDSREEAKVFAGAMSQALAILGAIGRAAKGCRRISYERCKVFAQMEALWRWLVTE